MKDSRSSAAIILAFVLAVSAAAAADRQPQPWTTDVQQAWQRSRTEQRPMLLYVSKQGCPYCRMMETGTLRDPALMEHIQSQFVTAAVEAHAHADFVQRLSVRAFPTLLVIDRDGRAVAAIVGYVSAAQLQERLNNLSTRLAENR